MEDDNRQCCNTSQAVKNDEVFFCLQKVCGRIVSKHVFSLDAFTTTALRIGRATKCIHQDIIAGEMAHFPYVNRLHKDMPGGLHDEAIAMRYSFVFCQGSGNALILIT